VPLVNTARMLGEAQRYHYAIGAFNVNNMEAIQAVIQAAEMEKSPVIIQVSMGAMKYGGRGVLAAIVKAMADIRLIPIALHFDHGEDFMSNMGALKAGYTSLMFDGSRLPLEENIRITADIAQVTHHFGVGLEAELGYVPKSSEGLSPAETLADPAQVKDFVTRSGCNSLAVAIGSVHGMDSSTQNLDIKRLQAIREQTDVPLVLHGASGVTKDAIREAIANGICKVNVGTEIQNAMIRGVKDAVFTEQKDIRDVMQYAKNNVEVIVRDYIRLFKGTSRAY
jgi:ketose-bisphosphate aldolase